MQNELVEYGKFAACRSWGHEANACLNYGAAGAARRGVLWSPSKRSLSLVHKVNVGYMNAMKMRWNEHEMQKAQQGEMDGR